MEASPLRESPPLQGSYFLIFGEVCHSLETYAITLILFYYIRVDLCFHFAGTSDKIARVLKKHGDQVQLRHYDTTMIIILPGPKDKFHRSFPIGFTKCHAFDVNGTSVTHAER